MKWKCTLIILAMIASWSCSSSSSKSASQSDEPPVAKADKPFAAGGTIEMQLDGGDYAIRAARDEHIRVSFSGNTDKASADLTTTGASANLVIRDTPHSNFRATIEVPATSNLAVRLTAGNLQIAAIIGNKDIDSKAGNVGIEVPSARDYATVDASVTVGDLKAGPFADNGSGIMPRLKWSGPGRYTLRAVLGAGNLEFKH